MRTKIRARKLEREREDQIHVLIDWLIYLLSVSKIEKRYREEYREGDCEERKKKQIKFRTNLYHQNSSMKTNVTLGSDFSFEQFKVGNQLNSIQILDLIDWNDRESQEIEEIEEKEERDEKNWLQTIIKTYHHFDYNIPFHFVSMFQLVSETSLLGSICWDNGV